MLGKWLGLAILSGMYLILMGGGILLSVQLISGYQIGNALAGMALIYFEALLVMSITVAGSSAFSTLATGGVVFGLYGLAFLGGWVEQFGNLANNPTAVDIGIMTSLIIPSEAIWKRAAYLMSSPVLRALGAISPFTSSSVPSPLMMWYALAYLLLMLFLAVRIFSRRDL